MKIRVYSDLHLDWFVIKNPDFMEKHALVEGKSMIDLFWTPPHLDTDKDTVLILSGDIWEGIKPVLWGHFSYLKELSYRFKYILVVPGNHDYWGESIKSLVPKANNLLKDMNVQNVKYMDKDCFKVDDVLFVGTTLWTDMNKMNPLAMFDMPRIMRPDSKIIYQTFETYIDRFTSQKWVQEHYDAVDYIKMMCELNRDSKIVVITHHAPLNMLTDPAYEGDLSNAYYSSDLSNLILDNENIILWTYGHIHYQRDVKFEHCRIVNNCVGYLDELGVNERVKHEVIEI